VTQINQPHPTRPAKVPLRWETIAASEGARHPDVIGRLVDRSLDGLTITGVFSPSEIAAGLAGLEGGERIPRPFGTLLGMPLGMSGGDAPERAAYHDDVDRSRARYREAFGFDPHARLAQVLSPFGGGMPMVAPLEDGRPYNPGHMRWWTPGGPGLQAHVGNEFRRHLEHSAMKHLLTVTRVLHHLSYFVVLQQPDVGGALSVYDLLWEQDEGLEDWIDGEREDTRFDSLPCTKFDLPAGDMVIFGGGWRWHRVDPLGGTRQRITYGGFAAPSIDGTELHFWA